MRLPVYDQNNTDRLLGYLVDLPEKMMEYGIINVPIYPRAMVDVFDWSETTSSNSIDLESLQFIVKKRRDGLLLNNRIALTTEAPLIKLRRCSRFEDA